MVPNGWITKQVKDICSQVSVGIVIKPAQYYVDKDQGVRAFRSANVREGRVGNGEWVYLSHEGNLKNSKSQLKTGDVLVVRSGYPGTACVLPEEYNGSNCIDIIFARPQKNVVIPEYLCAFTNSEQGKKQVLNTQGGLAQKHLNVDAYGKMRIPLPPLPEQKKIARILSTWDKAIETVDKLIENSKQQKKALMQQLLTGKKRLPEFSGEWKTIKLNKLCNVRRGASPRPISDAKWFADEGRGWIRIADATASESRYLTETTQKLSPLGVEKSVSVDPGDLIMSICGTIGVPRILSIAACIHDGFVVFRDYADKLHLEFLCHYLNLFTLRLANSGQPGTQKNLNTTIVGNLEVPLIAIEEQIAIANVLNKAEEHALSLQKEHDMLTVQKQALMQQLLTGKRRVKVDDDRSLAQAG